MEKKSDERQSQKFTNEFHFGYISKFGCFCFQVTIKQASGLPPSLSNFVFCQYTLWTHPDNIVVPPKMNPDQAPSVQSTDSMTFTFDHSKEFTFPVTEEFVEHCAGTFNYVSLFLLYICFIVGGKKQ